MQLKNTLKPMKNYVYLVLQKFEMFDFKPNCFIKLGMAGQLQSEGDKALLRVYLVA